jgi:hypothetical protein
MTITANSNINFLSINENFPVAGQDNDTQVFRDNFDTIKTSLSAAKTEVDELLGAVARLDREDNDFGINKISNVVLSNARTQTNDARTSPLTAGATIDALSGGYQIYTIGADISIDFLNFAGDTRNVPVETEIQKASVSKVTLELYSDLTASDEYTVTFTLSGTGATQFKKRNWPDSTDTIVLTAASADNPIIIEFWRHDLDTIYVNYLGEFA